MFYPYKIYYNMHTWIYDHITISHAVLDTLVVRFLYAIGLLPFVDDARLCVFVTYRV